MLSVLFGIGLMFANSLYFGPKFDKYKRYRINELHSYYKTDGVWKDENLSKDLSWKEQQSLILFLDSLENNNPEASKNTRPNLIINGLEFIKEKPVFGIGPGEFIQRHLQKKTKRDVGTLTSAHCFPIEIISEFGLIAWGYFLLLGVILFSILNHFIQYKKWNCWLIAFAVCLIPIWNMPSAFLYFDIHRLLLPLLVVYLLNLKTTPINV